METSAKSNGNSGTGRADVSATIPAIAQPLSEEPTEIASNIKYHAHFSPHFSPFKFEPEQAYYATADSVRDRLIKQWNDTYLHYDKVNPKQTYYLSMEYLQGRTLTNAIGNLDIHNAYADALKKLGHELEEVVEQEKDAALGNGGLGRLASCFLDSMATLNLPAWGYGLRYKYGLFKQLITKVGQEEGPEDWLEKFSPWEVVRHDVIFPVSFLVMLKFILLARENGLVARSYRLLHMMCQFQDTELKTLTVFVSGKPKQALRISTCFCLMMDSMNPLHSFILGLSRFVLFFTPGMLQRTENSYG